MIGPISDKAFYFGIGTIIGFTVGSFGLLVLFVLLA